MLPARFSMGSFDVDDLILNTAGGVLGYGVFLMLKLIFSGTTRLLTRDEKERVSL